MKTHSLQTSPHILRESKTMQSKSKNIWCTFRVQRGLLKSERLFEAFTNEFFFQDNQERANKHKLINHTQQTLKHLVLEFIECNIFESNTYCIKVNEKSPFPFSKYKHVSTHFFQSLTSWNVCMISQVKASYIL